MSITDFIKSMTPLMVPDRMNLVYELYNVFTHVSGSRESFDKFYFWGETLLRDFDEIDKFLVDPGSLFSNLANLKDLEQVTSYLDDEQKDLIRSFWSTFDHKYSRQQKDFLSIWNVLFRVYEKYRTDLSEKSLAYDGMIYRQVTEKMEAATFKDPFHTVIFAGFNALSPAEESIITWYVRERKAHIYWDTDDYYLKNKSQEAGRFMREIITKNEVLSKTFKSSYGDRFNSTEGRRITLVGTPLKTGQAQIAASLLEMLKHEKGRELPEEQTALILPDEQLLFPVLNALPRSIEKVNITMGFPLKHSLVYGFIENLIKLQMTRAENDVLFHYKPVLALLQHPFISHLDIEQTKKLVETIRFKNKIYITAEDITGGHELLSEIFIARESVPQLIDYIRQLLVKLSRINSEPLHQEFLVHFYTTLNKLNDFIHTTGMELNEQSFLKLFRQLVMLYKLPFEGEPLEGLQVMGAMETRNLDFDRIIVFSVNDGVLPPARPAASFIPYGLRRAFGLPVFDDQEAMYAYLFYRMIQRSKQVYLIYDTSEDQGLSGDISRFVKQIEFELRNSLTIDHKIISPPIPAYAERKLAISKNREMILKLNHYTDQTPNDEKWLTPSALNSYQECNLRFYYRYILGLREQEEVQEDMDPILFGQIFHSVMELAYQDHNRDGNRQVLPENVKHIKKGLDAFIEQAFQLHLDQGKGQKKFDFSGQNIIIREIVKKMAGRLLDYDLHHAPFEILGLESDPGIDHRFSLEIEQGGQKIKVRIGGIIDRIDRSGDVIRILDYKTGIDKKVFRDIRSLFSFSTDEEPNNSRNKAAFQTFFYGLIYKHSVPGFTGKIEAGLFNVREMYKKDFSYLLNEKINRSNNLVKDVTPYLPTFKEHLRELLEDIFSFDGHFYQTEDEKKCRFCSFRELCRR
jgi:hypothetical protein